MYVYIQFFRFRIMAIDHGQFSFVDVKHNAWPIVLVTNPKTVYLVPPVKESVILSSHIRCVYSASFVVFYEIRVDSLRILVLFSEC